MPAEGARLSVGRQCLKPGWVLWLHYAEVEVSERGFGRQVGVFRTAGRFEEAVEWTNKG